jgi:hypothetical protein
VLLMVERSHPVFLIIGMSDTTHGREDSYRIAHARDTKHHMLIHLCTCYEKNCYGFSFDFVTYGFI